MIVILRMGPVGRSAAVMLYGTGEHFDGEDIQDRRELLPKAEFWPVMPPDQTHDWVRERILEFGRTHRA